MSEVATTGPLRSAGSFTTARARRRYFVVLGTLLVLAVVSGFGLLAWANPMPVGSTGFWRIAQHRATDIQCMTHLLQDLADAAGAGGLLVQNDQDGAPAARRAGKIEHAQPSSGSSGPVAAPTRSATSCRFMMRSRPETPSRSAMRQMAWSSISLRSPSA